MKHSVPPWLHSECWTAHARQVSSLNAADEGCPARGKRPPKAWFSTLCPHRRVCPSSELLTNGIMQQGAQAGCFPRRGVSRLAHAAAHPVLTADQCPVSCEGRSVVLRWMLWSSVLQVGLVPLGSHATPQWAVVTHLPPWGGCEGRVVRVTQLLLGAPHFRKALGPFLVTYS